MTAAQIRANALLATSETLMDRHAEVLRKGGSPSAAQPILNEAIEYNRMAKAELENTQ